MDRQFWTHFAYGFAAVNTFCIMILLEMLIFDIPYVSLFFMIFALTIYLNFKKTA